MTYPPNSPGYQSAQPTTQFAAPTQQLGRAPEPSPAGPSKLPMYLNIAVAVFGLAVYLANFGPQFTISNSDFPQLGTASGSTTELGLAVVAALLAGLVAGFALLPKQKAVDSWVAVISVLAFLVILAETLSAPSEVTIGWGLYVVVVFSFLQAGAAIANLLLSAGVITAPEPKARYDQPQQGYGQYPGQQYYGQPQAGQQHGGQQHGQHQGPPQQRPGYPQQYGYAGAPSTGGFSVPGQQGGQQSGPPTPPTGFPAYGQPQPPGSSADTGPQGTVAASQQQPPQGQPSGQGQQTQQGQQPASQQTSPPAS